MSWILLDMRSFLFPTSGFTAGVLRETEKLDGPPADEK